MYSLLPRESIPPTLPIREGENFEKLPQRLRESQLEYPLFMKPDVGERGFMARKIQNEPEWQEYHQKAGRDYLVQTFIDLPMEVSLFYYRYPHESRGHITSLVGKELLSVKGDGRSTLKELIMAYPRACLQWEQLKKKWDGRINDIIAKDDILILVENANHSKGAKFCDLTHMVDDALLSVIENCLHNTPDFYYGRFDIKCLSIESLKEGKDFCIIELNGVGAEPIDMYVPDLPLLKGWQILLRHWNIMYQIAKANQSKGFQYPPSVAGFRKFFAYRRLVHH